MILATKKEILHLFPKGEKSILNLEKFSLLPLKISKSKAFFHFVRTLGLRYSDGCIYKSERNNSYSGYLCFGKEIDAINFIRDTKNYWGLNLKFYFKTNAHYIYIPTDILRLMIFVGCPIGNKTQNNFRLPNWVFKLPPSLKWAFIDGLFSGDGDSPRLKESGNSSESLRLSLNSEEKIVKQFCNGFMKDIKKLISGLGVKVTYPEIKWGNLIISKKKIKTYPIIIRILTEKKNMIKFLENVPYTYKNSADTNNVLFGLKYENRIKELKDFIKNYQNNDVPGICILLKDNFQKKLIINAANIISNGSQWGKYKKLAIYLKKNCKNLSNLKLSSITDNYFLSWKSNKKFIPIDCAIELSRINNIDLKILEEKINKLKVLRTHNKYGVELNKFTK